MTMETWAKPFPAGAILERTTRDALEQPSGSPCPDVRFSEEAVSEQDFVASYYDTVTNSFIVIEDPIDGRRHVPLGIEIQQRSFSWTFSYVQGFVIFEFDIKNIGVDVLEDMYFGLYVDFDVAHSPRTITRGYKTTFAVSCAPCRRASVAATSTRSTWPGSRITTATPPRTCSITGRPRVRPAYACCEPRIPISNYSFNWWVSHTDVSKDWGPNKRDSKVEYVLGNLGTPVGDRAKYQMMSNGEFDYDQVESALDHQARGWLPPVSSPALAEDLADGFDTRFLLSFGPFTVLPDSILPLTVAFIGARDFHLEPLNYQNYFDPYDPEPYYEHLDFENLGNLARWAGWVYDTPGLDRDGDGYRGRFRVVDGDTSCYQGDGVPDYRDASGPARAEAPLRHAAGRHYPALERRRSRDRARSLLTHGRPRGVSGVHEPDRTCG